MVSSTQTIAGAPATVASTVSTPSVSIYPNNLPLRSLQTVSGCLVVSSVATHPPDILATSQHPAPAHPDSDHSHAPAVAVPVPHPYQGVAGPYPRAPVPVSVADPLMAAPVMQAMYPALHGHAHPTAHPVVQMAGHGPGSTDLGVPPSYHLHTADATVGVTHLGMGGEALPDIVHSHNVGHALTPRQNQHRSATGASAARHHRQRHHTRSHGHSRTNREGGGRSNQQRRRSRAHSTASSTHTEGRCKEPCVKCMVTVTSFRWVLVVLSLLGVLCVVTGIVLAALHAAGNSFLFLAIMFIGLGVLLVIVVAVGWKCTPRGHEPLHALFSIGDFRNGRRERRTHRHRHRDGNWYGGMMYPEFQYRRPPPSYAASMQEYNSQLALVQANNNNSLQANTSGEDYSLPGSPPPSYRSRASTIHSGVHITFPPGHDSAPNSRPPTYRSRAESRQRPRLPLDDASGDVAFTGPLVTADIVQQNLGTRLHQRQGSSGTGVWHTRSASADLAQEPDFVRHRRVASLDQAAISAGLNVSSQGPHGPSPLTVSPDTEVVTHSGDNGQTTVTVRVMRNQESASRPDAQQAQPQAAGAQVTGSGNDGSEGKQLGGEGGVTSVTVNASSGSRERDEPEQYNTAL